jgi:macrocin-O-methyltransferase TylF-like protien
MSLETASNKPASPATAKNGVSLKHRLRLWLKKRGIELSRIEPGTYDQDNLRTRHNHDFLSEPRFLAAYKRGREAAGKDYLWHWRVHVGLWVAEVAKNLEGDFVECGVNRGFLSSAIMRHLNWNSLNKTFYLLDTFKGIDERYISEDEKKGGTLEYNRAMLESQFYVTNIESVKKNFSEWKGTKLIQGAIPETLSQVDSQKIAFLHLDMNCSPPEVAAADFFWPRLVPGALILLDDYGDRLFKSSKVGMDRFAAPRNVTVLSLPTGQGLIIKPPHT